MQRSPVIIVGAGLAGLCCARELQRRQIPWLLLEAKHRVGGRVQTDAVDGFLIDHGFQVLQTAYPEARRELQYDSLRLRPFAPGALIRTQGRFVEMADPWRRPGKLLTVLFNGVGTFSDRLRLAWLRASLHRRPPQSAWQTDNPDGSTADYLRHTIGFSEDIIRDSFARGLLVYFLNRIWPPPAACFVFSSVLLPPVTPHCPRMVWNRSRDSWRLIFRLPISA